MRVHPTLVPDSKQLASVDGVLNAVMITGSAVGELVLIGPGAGGAATASSVCADLIDIVRQPGDSGLALGMPVASMAAKPMIPSGDIASEWYVRLTAADQPGVMSEITHILAAHDISIESLVQNPSAAGEDQVPIVLLTHLARETVMNEALQEIMDLEGVQPQSALIRVESFDH